MTTRDFWRRIEALAPSRQAFVREHVKRRLGRESSTDLPDVADLERPIPFGLSFFASTATGGPESDRYGFLVECARIADRLGVHALWIPERHFGDFGAAHPNPSVLGAALAMVTTQIHLRAGSVTAPLHEPMRIAEEWAIVDNLSGGRAGVALAVGWHATDFALAPDHFRDRHERADRALDTLRACWRGEPQDRVNGHGEVVSVVPRPRPVQPELPIWRTTGSREGFVRAGKARTGVLCGLMGATLDGIAANIRAYRQAYREAGGDGDGHVVLALHTFVHPQARELGREPLRRYLASFLRAGRTGGVQGALSDAASQTTEADTDSFLDFTTDRYLKRRSLIGTPSECRDIVRRVAASGVDEIACFVDFGIEESEVLRGIEQIANLQSWTAAEARTP